MRTLVRPAMVLGAALVGTVLFGWLVGFAVAGVAGPGPVLADALVAEQLTGVRSPAATTAMKAVTWFGNRGVVLGAMALICAALWAAAKKTEAALFLASSVLGGYVLSHLVKDLVHRLRPVEGLVHASGGSFPSGHAVASVTLYAGLAFLLSRHFTGRALAKAAWAVAGILIVLIGLSRVYLGVHWTSDVMGGILLGALWTTACAMVLSGRLRSSGA